jgi:hypothetical protein
MGRPRTPNHLKILAGEREDRINRNDPLPAESAVIPLWRYQRARK